MIEYRACARWFRRIRRRTIPIVALCLAVLVLAACASDGSLVDHSGEAGSSAEDDETAAADGSGDPILDFYQCLRDNGLDVADPGPGDAIGLQGLDMDDPATAAVVEQCGDTHLASSDGRVTIGGGQMGDNLAAPSALIDFVDCLRGHGIDMQDPLPDGRLTIPDNIDPNSPEFQNAAQDCAQHLDGGGILMGDGSGGGTVGQR